MAEADFYADGVALKFARRTRRRFTLVEANRTLPLVGRIVRDLVAVHAEARRLHTQLEHRIPRDVRREIESDLDRVVQKLEHHVDELTEIGCDVIDYGRGGVGFPARHLGRDVSFCWRLGDEKITHWQDSPEPGDDAKPVTVLIDALTDVLTDQGA